MARSARMYSRSRGPGLPHGIEKRRVTWALTCVPNPSMKRPPLSSARSQAVMAVVIGDRAKATAMAVPSSSSGAASAATASGKKGSWLVSAVNNPR